MSCISDIAVNEPLVDVVNSKQVVTNSSLIKVKLNCIDNHEYNFLY